MWQNSVPKFLLTSLSLSLGLFVLEIRPSQALNFNFAGSGGNLGNNQTFLSNDNTTSINVFGFKDVTPLGQTPVVGNIDQNVNGLGIIGIPPSGNTANFQRRVGRDSSTNTVEGLEFVFDTPVTLNSLSFNAFDTGSQFSVFVDNTTLIQDINISSIVSQSLFGSSFLFSASNDASNFRIIGLEATPVTTNTTPEPNTLLSLIVLTGIGLIFKKYSAT